VVDIGPELRADAAREIMAFTQHDQVLDDVEAFVERALAFNPRRRRDLLRQSLRHNLRQLPDGRWTWKWDTRRLRDVDLERLGVEHAALWEWVGRIRCPTLVVRGERSRVFLPEDEAALAAAIPQARRVVVAGAGHTVQGDNPAALAGAVREFAREALA
jgi:esterase